MVGPCLFICGHAKFIIRERLVKNPHQSTQRAGVLIAPRVIRCVRVCSAAGALFLGLSHSTQQLICLFYGLQFYVSRRQMHFDCPIDHSVLKSARELVPYAKENNKSSLINLGSSNKNKIPF